jgi:hypothetical protein
MAGRGKAIEAFTVDNDEMGAMIARVDLDGEVLEDVVADWMPTTRTSGRPGSPVTAPT